MMKTIIESKEKLHWQGGWSGSECKIIIQGEKKLSNSRKGKFPILAMRL
jgi:hypothetical protein